LYVQQEAIDRDFLASTKVGTPDPRQVDPPEGQRILIGWDYPKSVFSEGLTLVLTARLWDSTQKVLFKPIERKRDVAAFFFPSDEKEKKILTYRIQVINGEGKILETWKHHFWTELIEIDRPPKGEAPLSPPSLSMGL
jgi:hypothetical protein